MQYELECGHCGYQFVLNVAELPRATKCAVCGGVLTLAVPVPLAPLAPPPKPVPLPVPPVPAPSPVPADTDSPRDWTRLAEPWRSVCSGLWLMRNGTTLVGALWVLFLCVTALVTLCVEPEQRWWFRNLSRFLLVTHLVPAVLHVAGQLRCQAVDESDGRRLVTTCCVLSLLSCVSLCCLGSANSLRLTGWLFTALNLVAFGFWLAFLAQLGRRLRDDALTFAIREFHLRFWFGVALLAPFLDFATNTGTADLWVGLTGISAIGFYLLWKYSALLRTAMRAVRRAADVTPSA